MASPSYLLELIGYVATSIMVSEFKCHFCATFRKSIGHFHQAAKVEGIGELPMGFLHLLKHVSFLGTPRYN